MVKATRQSPAKTSAQLLEEMLAEIDSLGPACVPETVDWGPDRGAEIIDDAYSRGEIAPPDDRRTPGASTRPRKKSST
ncbi:chalcone isomerase family protein [Bradyrhizobium sp.]